MGTSFDVADIGDRFSDYLKIALVHHHPYPYPASREAPILDPRSWIGREEFMQMEDATEFLTWCSSRDIRLVLHGHKHIPRLIHDLVAEGDWQGAERRRLTTVGCGSSLGANGRELSYNIIEWQPESRSWNVDFRVAPADGRNFRSAAIESQAATLSVR
jgi:hypothetical protein